MARKIKTISDVEVIDIGDKGKAIGRSPDGRIVLVDHAVPGDIVDVWVKKRRKGMLITTPVKYTQYSSQRVTPFCKHFGVCGGCKWRHLDYQAQLHFKEEAVRAALSRIAQIPDAQVLPIVPAPANTHFRNKLEFTFTNQRWLTEEEISTGESLDRRGLGFHVPGSFARVVDLEECHLQGDPSNAIRQFVRNFCRDHDIPFQNIRDRTGLLRNLIVRSNSEGQCMVILIVTREDTDTLNILDALSKQFPEISSLYYCVNPKLNDSYFDLDFQCYRGDEKLLQTLGHIRFMLGPKSFFQTNPEQAQALYDTALDFAELSGDDLVYDLYCGIGSITLYMAHQCRHVVGIEEIPEAIADARENAGLNQISNVTFYAGDVKEVLGEIREKHGAPDIVITDPPRAGMHTSAIQHLIDLAPQKIVYVSCNPATQARDIGLLSDDYQFDKARPLDMFPHTSHIENVVLLTRN